MKTVIIGANGTIGKKLFSAFPGSTGLTAKRAPSLTTVRYDWPSLSQYVSDADVVVYTVGVSKFAECEQFPEKSLYLNVSLPHKILRNLSSQQKFVYFSSPIALYDFGAGKKPNYAVQKKMAENGLQQDNVLIIRPSKVIESAQILQDWKKALAEGRKITAFADQAIAPVNTGLLADQLNLLLRNDSTGAYNFSAKDRLTYLDCAKALASHFKLNKNLIESKSAHQNNQFFFEQDVLDCSAAQQAIGYAPPPAKDILNEYFRTLA